MFNIQSQVMTTVKFGRVQRKEGMNQLIEMIQMIELF